MVCLQGSALSSHGPGRPFPGPGSCSDAHTRMFSQHNRAVRLCPVTNRHSRTEKSTSTAGEIHPPTPPPTKPRARCAHSCYHFLHRRVRMAPPPAHLPQRGPQALGSGTESSRQTQLSAPRAARKRGHESTRKWLRELDLTVRGRQEQPCYILSSQRVSIRTLVSLSN